MRRITLFASLITCCLNLSIAQVYMEKQTRHRFAQLNWGIDFSTSFGGATTYINQNNTLIDLDLSSTIRPRFILGGTHFWGHADIYIAIPLLYPKQEEMNQEIQHLRGVETAFKFYPWKIQDGKIRPYVGVSISPFNFEHSNNNLNFGNGPELTYTNLPILAGVTYNRKNQLFELGLAWNHSNERGYHISRALQQSIKTPPLYLNLSYRFIIDTTLGSEESWESGYTQKVTEQLADQNQLDGFYFGIGLSSAFWLGSSSYNTTDRPYIERYGISIMPDLSVGYYLHQTDLNIALGYRGYGETTNTYGTKQTLRRNSVVFEVTKYVFDYNGFVPFIGPALSYEGLSFEESFESSPVHNLTENNLTYGLTFGWDIRPNRVQSWLLRTNLRWFPSSSLEVEADKEVSFRNIEFNFIQLIIYPNRMFGRK